MPYRAKFETDGVLVRWSGHMTTKELLGYLGELHAHERFERVRYEIHDFRSCESVHFDKSEAELAAAVDYAGSHSSHGAIMNIAVVARDPAVAEGIRAYTEPGLSPYPLRIFPDLEAAKAWLQASAERPIHIDLDNFPA